MVNVKVTKILDKAEQVFQDMAALADKDVLVGVPEKKANRKEDAINNAQLVYIHTHGVRKQEMRREMAQTMTEGKPYSEAFEVYLQSHGSPLWHSPPRPILEPAIEDGKEMLALFLKEAAEKRLAGDVEGYLHGLKKAGMQAQNIVRDWFTNPKNNWAPNAPSTIRQKGSDRPLIDENQLRRAITYVVSDKGGGTK